MQVPAIARHGSVKRRLGVQPKRSVATISTTPTKLAASLIFDPNKDAWAAAVAAAGGRPKVPVACAIDAANAAKAADVAAATGHAPPRHPFDSAPAAPAATGGCDACTAAAVDCAPSNPFDVPRAAAPPAGCCNPTNPFDLSGAIAPTAALSAFEGGVRACGAAHATCGECGACGECGTCGLAHAQMTTAGAGNPWASGSGGSGSGSGSSSSVNGGGGGDMPRHEGGRMTWAEGLARAAAELDESAAAAVPDLIVRTCVSPGRRSAIGTTAPVPGPGPPGLAPAPGPVPVPVAVVGLTVAAGDSAGSVARAAGGDVGQSANGSRGGRVPGHADDDARLEAAVARGPSLDELLGARPCGGEEAEGRDADGGEEAEGRDADDDDDAISNVSSGDASSETQGDNDDDEDDDDEEDGEMVAAAPAVARGSAAGAAASHDRALCGIVAASGPAAAVRAATRCACGCGRDEASVAEVLEPSATGGAARHRQPAAAGAASAEVTGEARRAGAAHGGDAAAGGDAASQRAAVTSLAKPLLAAMVSDYFAPDSSTRHEAIPPPRSVIRTAAPTPSSRLAVRTVQLLGYEARGCESRRPSSVSGDPVSLMAAGTAAPRRRSSKRSFVVYQLRTRVGPFECSSYRRFSDFLGLHARLQREAGKAGKAKQQLAGVRTRAPRMAHLSHGLLTKCVPPCACSLICAVLPSRPCAARAPTAVTPTAKKLRESKLSLAPKDRRTEQRMVLLQRYCAELCAAPDLAQNELVTAFFWPSGEDGAGSVVAPDGSRASMSFEHLVDAESS